MKKNLMIIALGLVVVLPAKAQWTNSDKIPRPGQKLRFALIFEALPEDAKEFDFIEPSTFWQFKDIKCK